MSDKLGRIQLDDESVMSVAGGKVRYVSNPDQGNILWGEKTPDVQYSFKNFIKVQQVINQFNDKEDEQGIIQTLLASGIIWPI